MVGRWRRCSCNSHRRKVQNRDTETQRHRVTETQTPAAKHGMVSYLLASFGNFVVLQKLVWHIDGHEEVGEVRALLEVGQALQRPVHDGVDHFWLAINQACSHFPTKHTRAYKRERSREVERERERGRERERENVTDA